MVGYRGYWMEFTKQSDGWWFGHILYIGDLITAMSKTHNTITLEAKDAINDYLDTCIEEGVKPNNPDKARAAS